MSKPNRTPKPFRKPLKEKNYQRKIRNRIYLEPDREFLDEITARTTDGLILLARDLDEPEKKRLRKIAKEARKNRGSLALGKLLVLAVLAAAVVLFNVVFRDRLVERGAERLLESLFQAESELTGVEFRPLAGEIGFESMTVADADTPLSNLFALGRGRVEVDTWQLANGRVIIRELTVDGLAFGTAREASGTIDRSASRQDPSDAPVAGSGTDDDAQLSLESLGLPTTLDAQAFVQQFADELNTPAAVEQVVDTGSDYVGRWESEVDRLIGTGAESASEIAAFAATDFDAIGSVDEAIALVDASRTLIEDAEAYAGEVQTSFSQATAEAEALLATAGSVADLVQEDYTLIRAQIPDVRTEGTDFMVALIEPFLRERLGDWYERILTAYEIALRIRAQNEDRPPRARRSGELISFGPATPPRFELQDALLSGRLGTEQELTLRGLSSDPDRTGSPAEIAYESVDGGRVLALSALIDGRTDADEGFSLQLRTLGNQIEIDRGLDAIGINRFSGETAASVALAGSLDQSIVGSIDLRTSAMSVDQLDETTTIGELVSDLLQETPELLAAFAFGIDSAGAISLRDGSTNLDEGIASLVQERVDATLAAFEAKVQAQLDSLLGPELEQLNGALAEVVDTEAALEEVLLLARDREAAAAALQARAADATNQIRSALEAEAQERLDEARAQAEAAEARAREEAREAAEEAADDVRDEIRDRSPIRLPGF